MLDLIRVDKKRFFAIDFVDLLVVCFQWYFEDIVWIETECTEDSIDLELL